MLRQVIVVFFAIVFVASLMYIMDVMRAQTSEWGIENVITEEETIVHTKTDVVGIIMVSDKQFQTHQVLQYAAMRAYAHRHGYEFHLLDPAEIGPVVCKKKVG